MLKKQVSLYQELPEFFGNDDQVIDEIEFRNYVLLEFKRFRMRSGITLHTDCRGQKMPGRYKHKVAPRMMELTEQLLSHGASELFDGLVYVRARATLRKKIYLLATLDYHSQLRVLKSVFASLNFERSPQTLQAFFDVRRDVWSTNPLFHRPINWHDLVISDARLSPDFIRKNISKLELDYFFRDYPDGDIFHHPRYSFSDLFTFRQIFEAHDSVAMKPAISRSVGSQSRLHSNISANP